MEPQGLGERSDSRPLLQRFSPSALAGGLSVNRLLFTGLSVPRASLDQPMLAVAVLDALYSGYIHTAPLGRLSAGVREPAVMRIGQRPPGLNAGLEVMCLSSEHLSHTCHLANPVLAVGKMGFAGCWSWISRGKVWGGIAV